MAREVSESIQGATASEARFFDANAAEAVTGSRGMYLDRAGERWELEQVSSSGLPLGDPGSIASGDLSFKATRGKQVRQLRFRAHVKRELIGNAGAPPPERSDHPAN